MDDIAQDPTGDTPPAQPAPPAPTQPHKGGSIDISYHEEKISKLNGDLSSERKKLKAIEAERNDYKAKALAYEVAEKKRSIFEKVTGELGDDFAIDNDARAKLSKTISLLPDSEDLETTIKDIVDIAKRPVSKGKMSTTFGSGLNLGGGDAGIPDKEPHKYTDAELLKLMESDPDRYKEIRKARLKGQ